LPVHHHQAQAVDVHADRDHVARQQHVDVLGISVRLGQPCLGLFDGACLLSAGELDGLLLQQAGREVRMGRRGVVRPALGSLAAADADVVFDQPAHAAQLAQAVEVAGQGHVRIGRFGVSRS
jgi:hypothetical protein